MPDGEGERRTDHDYWIFPPWMANVFVRVLFASLSSAILFAGSTRTSTVCGPFWAFAAHCAVSVRLAPPARSPITWSAPSGAPSIRNRTATFDAGPAAMLLITAVNVSGSPPVSLFGETVTDVTVRSGNGAIAAATGGGPSGRPTPRPSMKVTHSADGRTLTG